MIDALWLDITMQCMVTQNGILSMFQEFPWRYCADKASSIDNKLFKLQQFHVIIIDPWPSTLNSHCI